LSDAVKIGTSQDPFHKRKVISRYEDIGLMFDEMTSRKLGLGDDEAARWRPVRPLRHGAFGAAGLFKRLDDRGNIDDVSQRYS
jgi:hypothetical protein